MVMKFTVVGLVALALLGSFCDAQQDDYKPAKPRYQKQVPKHEPQQAKLTFEKPLTWTYPEEPEPEPKADVPFEPVLPVPVATVTVDCRESIVHVEAKKDFFGIGQFINPADLTLGNCGAVAEDNTIEVLIYEAQLHTCHSTLTTTEDSLIYTFTMNYDPQPLGTSPVVRTSTAIVFVECHYPRRHNVSSLPLDPLWIPFSAVKVSEEFLYFTLTLMLDDWSYERPSYVYFLGDIINIQAVVRQFFHVPLRIYVDSCFASLTPDHTSTPRYDFIENNGCLVDSRITGSPSQFLPRSPSTQNTLQFQFEAFRFQGAVSGLLYITCHLKATSCAKPLDSEHRACYYAGGWLEASGEHGHCGSCESGSYGNPEISKRLPWSPGGKTTERKIRDVSQSEISVLEWEGVVTLGPIPIQERAKA
ncbi:zona pellucida sperm-binding protein 3-like [Cottoperca gobio]|uniref:Zona pellucida sperm-binding protein 3 n=1 Tax=Cottoperca gobio TaxID=56716 RepID=A0A6J2PVA8_COTGO|nr:zona pellucida sperm-binding protein 3-like [Cottoperca gobio]